MSCGAAGSSASALFVEEKRVWRYLHWRCATCCILPLREVPSWAEDLLGSRALQKNAPDFRETSPKSAGRSKTLYMVWDLILRHPELEDVY